MGMLAQRVGAALVAVAALAALAGCSQDAEGNLTVTVDKDDVYKIGCAAVDASVTGGSAATDLTVKGLKALQGSDTLGAEAQTWLDSAIVVLDAGSKDDIPVETRQLIADGCADQGYPLENLP